MKNHLQLCTAGQSNLCNEGRRKSRALATTILLFSIVLIPLRASADSEASRWGLNLSGSAEIGRMSNSGVFLQERTMNALSVQALPGYYISPKWMLGVSLNYRHQQQVTPLAEASGTNLAGKGWLAGLGLNYKISPTWSLQTGLHFGGVYEFDVKDNLGNAGTMKEPLGLDLKFQYRFNPESSWSLDGVANYIQWQKIEIAGAEKSELTKQWMVGAGLTYFIGRAPNATSESATKPETTETQTSAAVDQSKTKKSSTAPDNQTILNTDILEKPLYLVFFDTGSVDLKPEFIEKISQYVAALKKHPDKKVKVEGYTDTAGAEQLNEDLSQKRADNVKIELVQQGIRADRITAIGKGPIDVGIGNKSRRKSRRVEVHLVIQ